MQQTGGNMSSTYCCNTGKTSQTTQLHCHATFFSLKRCVGVFSGWSEGRRSRPSCWDKGGVWEKRRKRVGTTVPARVFKKKYKTKFIFGEVNMKVVKPHQWHDPHCSGIAVWRHLKERPDGFEVQLTSLNWGGKTLMREAKTRRWQNVACTVL